MSISNSVPGARRTFVLIHGGTHGGWCWARVADVLQPAGHKVFAPSLTGLGDRKHLLSPAVDLNTHINDIVNLIEYESLEDVVLVGHSYGGLPVTGVADRIPERLRHVVFLDAVIGQPGESMFGAAGPEFVAMRMKSASELNGTKVFEPKSAEFFGVTDAADAAWCNGKTTPQPALTYLTTLELRHPIGNGRPCTFIRCTDPQLVHADPFEAQASAAGMPIIRFPACHNAMVTRPAELSRLLLQIAG